MFLIPGNYPETTRTRLLKYIFTRTRPVPVFFGLVHTLNETKTIPYDYIYESTQIPDDFNFQTTPKEVDIVVPEILPRDFKREW